MTDGEAHVAAIALIWGVAIGMTIATAFWGIAWWING